MLDRIIVVYFILNLIFLNHINNCRGKEVLPDSSQLQKIQAATNLFSRKPRLNSEPKYRVKLCKCYNGWADTRKNLIVISEPSINNYSVKELAALIGHEIGHLEFPKGSQIDADKIGAELIGREIMIKQMERTIHDGDKVFEANRTLMILFPIPYLNYRLAVRDMKARVGKLKTS